MGPEKTDNWIQLVSTFNYSAVLGFDGTTKHRIINVRHMFLKCCFIIWKDVTFCGFHGDLSKLTLRFLTRYLNLIGFLIMTFVEK